MEVCIGVKNGTGGQGGGGGRRWGSCGGGSSKGTWGGSRWSGPGQGTAKTEDGKPTVASRARLVEALEEFGPADDLLHLQTHELDEVLREKQRAAKEREMPFDSQAPTA